MQKIRSSTDGPIFDKDLSVHAVHSETDRNCRRICGGRFEFSMSITLMFSLLYRNSYIR
jgi:hypothetical protein